MSDCPHCQNGHFHGTDVECINGVLIDVDVAHEGWQRDVEYPAAPCVAADGEWPDEDRGCQARLDEWAWGALVPDPDAAEAMRIVGIQHGLVSALVVLKGRINEIQLRIKRTPPRATRKHAHLLAMITPLREVFAEIDRELRKLQAGKKSDA